MRPFQGGLEMARPTKLIRFSKEGDRLTKRRRRLAALSQVLRISIGAFPRGDALRNTTWSQIRPRADDDYHSVPIRYAGATILFGAGPNWAGLAWARPM
jgi:hypothetical protein